MASYADHVAPSSTCRIAVSQPKLASKFGASMLPEASDSVTCFLKNGSGASTASNLVPAVRLTTTAYQRLTTPSRLQKIRPRIHSSFEICTLYSCPNCEELYRSDKEGGPDWPGCSPCSSFKHMRNWVKRQILDLRVPAGRFPTAVLSTKTKLLRLSSFTLKLWTHLHAHLASISKQPAFPKSILQLPIYNLKQQLLTQSYYSSWNCVRCCSVSTCQIAAVQLTLLPPPIRI